MRPTAGVPAWLDPADERAARAAWSRLAEPGDLSAGFVVEHLGAGPALLALFRRPAQLRELAARTPGRRGKPGLPPPGAGWAERAGQVEPYRDLRTVARFGGRWVVPGDGEWPVGLGSLGLRAPFGLWVRGAVDLAAAVARSVALVGCRASTPYGEWVAQELAAGCTERGITVVSGAAYGIDAQAHTGALAASGVTVAVLACGVDRVYPRGHDQLIERILRTGLVVGEVPPGSAPTRWRFVQRNRLIAALTSVTVVVEAGWRSGASITAGEAVSLGRDVAAVPGPVTSASSAGCHRLLRDGAVCVTDAGEIAELVDGLDGGAGGRPGCGPAAEGRPVPVADHDGLDETDVRVLDALPVRSPVDVDRLVTTAGLDRATVLAAVGRLELRGLAEGDGRRWRKAPRRRIDPGGPLRDP